MNLLVSFLEYMAVLYIILDNISPYSGAIDRNYYVAETAAILIVILLLLKCAMRKLQYRVLKRWGWFCIPYYILTISYFFASVSMDIAVTYAAKFLVMLPVLTLLLCIYRSEGQGNRLILVFVNIMAGISVVSLFFWVFASQMKVIRPTGSIYAKWATAHSFPSYLGVYFERQRISFFGYTGFRNQGIFSEAPMFSCCLIFALAMHMFLKPSNDRAYKGIILSARGKSLNLRATNWKGILFGITIVTTTTTLGILLMIIILFLRYMLIRSHSKTGVIVKAMFAIFIVFGSAYLTGTLIVNKMSTVSWIERNEDFQMGFRAWKALPFFGVGFNDYAAIFRVANGIYQNGFSSGIMAVFAQGGLTLALIYIVPLLGGMILAIRRRQYFFLAYNMIIWFEFIFTAIPYTFLLLFQLAFFYSALLTGILPNRTKRRNRTSSSASDLTSIGITTCSE